MEVCSFRSWELRLGSPAFAYSFPLFGVPTTVCLITSLLKSETSRRAKSPFCAVSGPLRQYCVPLCPCSPYDAPSTVYAFRLPLGLVPCGRITYLESTLCEAGKHHRKNILSLERKLELQLKQVLIDSMTF